MDSPLYGTVHRVEELGTSMLRVVFGGSGLDSFEPTDRTDQYVNALFIPDGADYAAPFNIDTARELEPELRPRGRRYTVRAWDEATRELTIDFVRHGDSGLAGPWAQRAQPGDTLQMVGPSGSYRPDPDADWHLLVGDESALPAIGAALDVMAPGSKSVVIAIVDGPDAEFELGSPGDVDMRWVHRCTASNPDRVLADAVGSLEWPSGKVDVFVHGEASEVRSVRRYLLDERDIDRSEASISPYWRRDHTDEAWRAVKRQWMADQDAATS